MKELNDSSVFEKEIEKGITIVDFFAVWCGPCKMLAPVLEEVSELEQYKGINFMKVDVDKHMKLAQSFKVRGVPTIILFKDGKPISSFSGYIPKKQVLSFIDHNK